MVLRNCFLSELISAFRNSDMKLYAITMKLPHASIAQKLFVTKSLMEKSYLSSLILFSESGHPRYESYIILAGSSRFVMKQLYRYFTKSQVSITPNFFIPNLRRFCRDLAWWSWGQSLRRVSHWRLTRRNGYWGFDLKCRPNSLVALWSCASFLSCLLAV